MSTTLLGGVGGVLAMIGVIACPITSGDTAFRSARLTIADWFKIDQKNHAKRLLLSAPLLLVGFVISRFEYQTIWRYFSWSNQTLAMITLWTVSVYLCKYVGKNISMIAAIPAAYMTSVSVAYILQAKEGFHLQALPSDLAGIFTALICFGLFIAMVYLKVGNEKLVDKPLEIR